MGAYMRWDGVGGAWPGLRLRCIDLGLCAATVVLVATSVTGSVGAQTASRGPQSGWTESPPWGSTAKSLAGAAPTARATGTAAGGPVPRAPLSGAAAMPMARQQPEQGLPSSSAWSMDRRALPAVFEDASRPAPWRPAAKVPVVAQRREVAFTWLFPPGSIVVVNRERALYHVGPTGRAIRYPVAIGSFTEEWVGVEFVTDKKVNPTWHPVAEPGKELREPVQGGDPANPLGARALYLGRTLWRIHGTPSVESIGQAVSSGCIRMHNDHVSELFDRVMLGTEVYVVERLADAPPNHRGRKLIE